MTIRVIKAKKHTNKNKSSLTPKGGFFICYNKQMLTPKEIAELSKKPWWSPSDMLQVLNTISELRQANANQANLLERALNQLDAYRDRVDFYRSTTTKLIG